MSDGAKRVAETRARKRQAGLRQITAFIPEHLYDAVDRVQRDRGLKSRGEALTALLAESVPYFNPQETPATR